MDTNSRVDSRVDSRMDRGDNPIVVILARIAWVFEIILGLPAGKHFDIDI